MALEDTIVWSNESCIIGQISAPKYTTDERVGLTTETGSLIYNTTEGKIQCYNGTSWKDLNS